ncbi:MAG TPA: TonB family protein, partial [Chitinophagales bacterium]|nr:TonB family protein [Chitinophagales bacterium]
VSQSKQDEGEKYPAIQKELKKQEVTLPEPVESVSNYEVQEDLATGKDNRKETYDFSDTQVTSVPASAEKRSVKMEDDSADEEFMVTDAYLSGTPASESDAIFITVEVMPQYPGGDKAMQEFIRKELRYPAAAKDASIQGTVYVNFVVDATGEVGNIKLIRGIGGGCDEEAMKMVSKMPRWKPGRQNGKNVPVSMTIPVQFKLQ